MINDINQKNHQVNESDMLSLVTIMKKMHSAAMDNDWRLVEELNQLRNNALINSNLVKGATIKHTDIDAKEILTLDKEVMALASQAIDSVVSKINSVSKQTTISQTYRLNK